MHKVHILPPLPLDVLRPDVEGALRSDPVFLLEAPPGTGKSTRVPFWALDCLDGRVLLIEPRRVAARMLAGHMAELTGTRPGGLVGYAMRRESRQSAATRLLIVTEGVLARMLADDPALETVSCVLFDEFHERHLTSDTGLALALRCQEILRPDLRLGILSATLDTDALLKLLPKAPVLRAEAPGHPVETRWRPVPSARHPAEQLRDLPMHMAKVIASLLREQEGSLLAFLPGQREIERTMEALAGLLPADCDVRPLYGRLTAGEQTRALAPCEPGKRKVVLATDVAETSLTIEGVRLVVDSGLQRRPRYAPGRAASRLVTQFIPLSSAQQRRGRAGRTEPGLCVRLWAKERELDMARHTCPEILDCELSQLALDLALWGEKPADLPFVTMPPQAAWQDALHTLTSLGALDGQEKLTAKGRAMAQTGLSPRTAAILLAADGKDKPAAALLCALLEDGAFGSGSGDARRQLEQRLRQPGSQSASQLLDLAERFLARADRQGKSSRKLPDRRALAALARDLADGGTAGRLLLSGFADRLVLRRDKGETGLVREGGGVLMPAGCPNEACLLALELALPDTARQADLKTLANGRVTLFCPVSVEDALSVLAKDLRRERLVEIQENGAAAVLERVRLDALVFSQRRAAPAPEDAAAASDALRAHVLRHTLAPLPWTGGIERWLARVSFCAQALGDPWPCLDRAALLAREEEWLPLVLEGCLDLRRLESGRLDAALRALVPWQCLAQLDAMAPESWTSPCGKKHPVLYGEGDPCCEVKLQECFGLENTPLIAGKIPLVLRLLSPAGARLAVTWDLPFFWKKVYPSVRAEMRGRYPRHPWPENPLTALPTALTQKALRAKGLA